ncbi:MAG: hypothetical protein M9884_14590, partial [Rhodocyclaceae bacterium]|nr:hypothetical protein [Rhodocyclaceae bacterium]
SSRVAKSGGSKLDENYPSKWVNSGWTSTRKRLYRCRIPANGRENIDSVNTQSRLPSIITKTIITLSIQLLAIIFGQ